MVSIEVLLMFYEQNLEELKTAVCWRMWRIKFSNFKFSSQSWGFQAFDDISAAEGWCLSRFMSRAATAARYPFPLWDQ